MKAAGIVSLAILFGLTLLMLADLIRFRKKARKHLRLASILALIFLVIYAGVYLSFPSVIVENVPLWILLGGVGLYLIQGLLFSTTGMYSCEEMGLRDVPLLRRLLGETDLGKEYFSRKHALDLFGLIVFATGSAFLLYKVAGLALLAPLEDSLWLLHGFGAESTTLPRALIVALGVLGAEVVYRLGLQNYIARQFKLTGRRYWIAIFVASAIGALTNVELEGPLWHLAILRLPVYVGLGALFRRYGLESCVVAHGSFMLVYFLLQG